MKPQQMRKSFADVLVQVAPRNAKRLIERARMANRLAKSLTGTSKAKAYRVKHGALIAISRHFPEQVTVCSDAQVPGFVVVEINSARFGLHIPTAYFATERGEPCAA